MNCNKWSLDVVYVLVKWRNKTSKLCDTVYCTTGYYEWSHVEIEARD